MKGRSLDPLFLPFQYPSIHTHCPTSLILIQRSSPTSTPLTVNLSVLPRVNRELGSSPVVLEAALSEIQSDWPPVPPIWICTSPSVLAPRTSPVVLVICAEAQRIYYTETENKADLVIALAQPVTPWTPPLHPHLVLDINLGLLDERRGSGREVLSVLKGGATVGCVVGHID